MSRMFSTQTGLPQSLHFSLEAKFSNLKTQNYCHTVLIKVTNFTARLSNVFWGQKSSNVTIVFLTCFYFSPLFTADICIPISESVLSPHISPLDEHNKHSTKEPSWRKSGKMHAKHPLKRKICSKKLQRKFYMAEVSFCVFNYNCVVFV